MKISRRDILSGLAASSVLPAFARAASAGASNKKLLVINITGGLDGLALVPPYGDPNLNRLRAPLLSGNVGTPGGMLDLGGFYALNPAMTNLHGMYEAGQAVFIHAVGNTGSSRSHFVGQDVLQSGDADDELTGWLDRVSGCMWPSPASGLSPVMTCGGVVPILGTGPAAVTQWTQPAPITFQTEMAYQISQLTKPDQLLGPAWYRGAAAQSIFNSEFAAPPPAAAGQSPLCLNAWAAATLLAENPSVCVTTIITPAYDTHFNQMTLLASDLTDLDNAMGLIKLALGNEWSNTVVMTMTEFGRTAAVNGTLGTDHGTAFAVFLAGGAVAGGRVLATWPGLSPSQLYQGQDLAPTLDFRTVAGSVLVSHLGLPLDQVSKVFPGFNFTPITGLTVG